MNIYEQNNYIQQFLSIILNMYLPGDCQSIIILSWAYFKMRVLGPASISFPVFQFNIEFVSCVRSKLIYVFQAQPKFFFELPKTLDIVSPGSGKVDSRLHILTPLYDCPIFITHHSHTVMRTVAVWGYLEGADGSHYSGYSLNIRNRLSKRFV